MAKKPLRDPNAPKRNMSAYLLYQNGMREQFRAQNPGMTFGQLAKYTSGMYSLMQPAEKEAWIARAEADKARYLHELASYVPPPGYDAKGDAIIPAEAVPVKKRKTGRDINAPKRNLSAYLLFQNAMREQYKRENPGMTFGQLAKYTSHMYKNLTPEEKQTWVARAEQDKARYLAQISVYVSPPGHDAHGNLIDVAHGKRQKRSLKDPDAPKRARGSFVFFTFEMRPQIMREFPGIKFVEMGTILGQRWRALTPEEKKRYEDMAAEDKVRFHVEMQKYTGHINQMEAQAQAAAIQQGQNQQVPAPMLQQSYYQDPTQPQQFDPTQMQQHQLQQQQQLQQQYDPTQQQQAQQQQQYDPNQLQQQQQQQYVQSQQQAQQQQQYDPNQQVQQHVQQQAQQVAQQQAAQQVAQQQAAQQHAQQQAQQHAQQQAAQQVVQQQAAQQVAQQQAQQHAQQQAAQQVAQQQAQQHAQQQAAQQVVQQQTQQELQQAQQHVQQQAIQQQYYDPNAYHA